MKATIADLHRKDSASLGAAELELVLALIRGRTLHGAAERLNIDASTVFRAIRRLEKALGETLFDRGRQGYVPTPLALDLGAHAERIESQLQEARAAVSGSSGAPTGVLRVTTTDTLLHSLLLPLAARFADLYPGIELELVATNALANLSRREADVAIRATRKPPEHLVGVRLGTLRAAVYASKDYLARGKPYPEGADWIVLDDSLPDHPSQAWRRQRYPKLPARHRVNSVMSWAWCRCSCSTAIRRSRSWRVRWMSWIPSCGAWRIRMRASCRGSSCGLLSSASTCNCPKPEKPPRIG
jgi:DNA-binding transcriptional LysR family regulator